VSRKEPTVLVTGVGAVTSVGLSARSTAAALRAGIARIGPIWSTLLDGPGGASGPAQGGRVPLEWFEGGPLEEEWPGHDRFAVAPPAPLHLLIEDGDDRLTRLASRAAMDCRQSMGQSVSPKDWGLFLGLGEHEAPGTGQRVADAVTEAWDDFTPKMVDVQPEGRASALLALQRAFVAIENGHLSGAIAGGVDSLVRPAHYERLAAKGVLRDANSNPQGILPGEAAAFLVLQRNAREGRALARVHGAAAALEPTAGTTTPNTGRALTAALRATQVDAPLKSMPLVICDLNGDRLRAMEWAMAQTRALGELKWRDDAVTSGDTWHPADCIGDCGAASGGVDSVWAALALQEGYALTEEILVWGASDGKLRAAMVFSRVG